MPKPKPQPKTEPPPSYIEREQMERCLTGYDGNRFIRYLRRVFGDEAASKATGWYLIGTSKKFGGGAAVFPQIDLQGNIRTGKIMQFCECTGKRVKIKTSNGEKPLIDWVHTALKLPDFNLYQCLFGEHLLKDNHKTVAICESEKTAIIASVYLPDMIWLASGGK